MDLFTSLPSNVQLYIRGLMLQSFAEETMPTVRNKIGDATAEIARQMFDTGQWDHDCRKWEVCKDAEFCCLGHCLQRDLGRNC